MSMVARIRPLWFCLSWLVIVTLLLPPGLAVGKPVTPAPVQQDPLPPSPTPTPTPDVTPTPEVTPTLPLTPTATVAPLPTLTPPLEITPTPTLIPTPAFTATLPPLLTPTLALTPTALLTATPTVSTTGLAAWRGRPQAATQTLTLTPAGGRLTTPDRRVRLDFPAQAMRTAIELVVQTQVPASPYQDNGRFRWLTVDVTPRDARRLERGHLRFAQPVTLTFDLTGFPAWLSPYVVHQVDAATDQWEWLPSQYDPETQQLTTQVTTFSQVGLEGASKFPDDGTHYLMTTLPDVSTFTGAATYAYPFPLPAGRAGLAPDLSLTYSSAGFNGLLGVVQSNYVGSGWSLGGLVAIVRSIKTRIAPIGGSEPVLQWDYANDFTLLLGGASYRLAGFTKTGATSGCRYYAEDAPQLLVMRYTITGTTSNPYCGYGPFASDPVPNTSQEYWVVTTAEGVQYRLGFTADAEQLTRMDGYTPVGRTLATGYAGEVTRLVVYRWAVDRIRDGANNAVFFGYGEEPEPGSGETWWDRAQYPEWIRYTGYTTDTLATAGATLVDFIYEQRRAGNDNSCVNLTPAQCEWHDDGEAAREYAMRDKHRLDRVRICTNVVGSGCPDSNASLAEYDLDYEFVEETWPGLEWIVNTIPHETTRLTSLTAWGWNAAGQKVALPAATFTYAVYTQADDVVDPGDKLVYPRLITANNGYGGQTTFTYELIESESVRNWRVTEKVTTDGLGHTARTAYGYTGACFSTYDNHYPGPNCRRADQEDPTYALIGHQATTVQTYDYDGTTLLNSTQFTFTTAKTVNRGKMLQTATYDVAQKPLQQQTHTWSLQSFGPPTLTVMAGYITRTVTTDYSSGGNAMTHRVDYAYDVYGNQTVVSDYGDVTPGDERTTHRMYYPNLTAWIVNRVARESVYAGIRPDDSNGSYLKSRTRYRYDNQACWDLAPGTQGRLTAVDRWAGDRGGTSANCYRPNFDITMHTYDTWGNVIQVTDPNTHTTVTSYDSVYHQFPTQVCRNTGSENLCSYTRYYGVNEEARSDDFGLFGQVQKTYDSNNPTGAAALSTYYSYDAFGRPVSEARPGDTLASPTQRYVYHGPISAPPVVNPSFEDRPQSMWVESDANNVQTYDRTTAQAYAGSRSLVIATTGTADHWVGQYLSGWTAGQTYQIRAYIKGSGQVCLGMSAKTGHETSAICHTATGTWQLIMRSVILPADATQFLLLIRTPQNASTVYVDEVYVQSLYAISAYAKEDAAGSTLWRRQVYDGLGRVLQTQAEFDNVTVSVVDQRYDARGLVIAQSVPYTGTSIVDSPWYVAPAAPAQTLTRYDALGRTTVVTAPDGSATHQEYRIDYNPADPDFQAPRSSVLQIDANQHFTRQSYDVYGQLRSVSESSSTWPAWGTETRTRYAYDTLGNLTTVTDAAGNVSRMQYDGLSRKTVMTDTDMGTWYYGYDKAGNLTRQTDALGQRICFYYDALNRLKGKHYRTNDACPTLNPTLAITYTYDAGTYGKGYRTAMTDTSGNTAWTYDARGRVTKEIKTLTGPGSFTTEWGYDAMDRVVTMKYPDNEIVTHAYNAQGALASLAGTNPYASNIAYNVAGQITALPLGNGLTTGYSYNPLTLRLQRVQVGPSGSLLDLRYTYDSVGNVATITDAQNSGQVQHFTYDARDRLTHAWTTGGGNGAYNWTYGYEAIGNIDWRKEDGTHYEYNYLPSGAGSVRPHAVTSVSSKGWVYSYNANGNMTGRTENSKTYTQIFDEENRLKQVTGGANVTFTYDGDGRRVKKVEGSTTTYYVGGYYEKQGSTITKYYYAGSQRIAMRKGGVVYYLHGDHLGSTSLTTCGSTAGCGGMGAEVARQLYYPYGQVRWPASSTLPTDYTFTGQRNEASFGLMDYNARYYDPYLNRFIQADTITQGRENPQALNRYSYTLNNPLKYVDDTGHCWGFASGLRGLPGYGTTCRNIDMALTIVQHPDASVGERAGAAAYIAAEGVAHTALLVGTGMLLWEGGAAVLAGGKEVVGAGTAAACADGDCTNEARAVVDRACADGDCTNEFGGINRIAETINCFEAGTLVLALEGSIPIEEIKIGDYVLGTDPETKIIGYYTVTEVFSHQVASLVELTIGVDVLRVTPEHPFWVAGHGWVEAEQLSKDDCIQKVDRTCQPVVSSRIIYKTTQVYNFAVATVHTYFVGESRYLVHNDCNGGQYTTNKNLVMKTFDLSKQVFNRAIHDIKKYVEGNPDMMFDLETGDVFDQRSGEIVGNLLDYID